MPRYHQTQRGPAAPTTSTPSLKPSLPSHVSPAVKSGTQSGGQALDRRTSAEMSARFGHDFSSIRIHTDSRAGESAQAMGANAFALGNDVVFGEGQYQPGSPQTDRLLAHELTHVVQQSQWGGPGDWGRTSRKGDASEREADSLAAQVMMGRSVQVQAAPGAAIARDGFATDENGDAPLDLSNPGPFGIPPQVLEAQGIESSPGPGVDGESTPATSAFTPSMGETADFVPDVPLGRAGGGPIGTAVSDPVADSGLGQPFMAPSLSGLSDLF